MTLAWPAWKSLTRHVIWPRKWWLSTTERQRCWWAAGTTAQPSTCGQWAASSQSCWGDVSSSRLRAQFSRWDWLTLNIIVTPLQTCCMRCILLDICSLSYQTSHRLWTVVQLFFFFKLLFIPCCLFQLDLITDLLGTPPLSALASACEGARAHILRGPHKPVRDCVVCSHSIHHQQHHTNVCYICPAFTFSKTDSPSEMNRFTKLNLMRCGHDGSFLISWLTLCLHFQKWASKNTCYLDKWLFHVFRSKLC